jgi:integrase
LGFKEYTVHGFRSSFRDWAGETTGHSREVIEQSLAHSLADQTEAAYQRGDYLEKRRALMADWAGYCFKPNQAGGEHHSKVEQMS